ncbi:MAG: hypothetical protein ACR2O3_05385, partial [Rhizobiaceae bacterium]
FARKPVEALAYGMDTLARCFHNVPEHVTTAVHMCCGYPNKLDATDYPKADPHSYIQIATSVDGITDQISIEDAHRHNSEDLFSLFEKSQLVIGFVKIASSQVESVEEIHARMAEILRILPAERVIAAPDCGLGFLSRELAMTKLSNMSTAAKSV